jgi:hypothetical protein
MRRRAVLDPALAAVAAAAQEATPAALADHPLAGLWLAMANPANPADQPFAAPSFFNADGSVLLVFPPIAAGPEGAGFQSNLGGVWEVDGERTGHFTVVQALAGPDGVYLGTATIDGHPQVSPDGRSFVGADPRSTVTIRDTAGAVVQQMPAVGDRPVTAIRMVPGASGFPEGALSVGTPIG